MFRNFREIMAKSRPTHIHSRWASFRALIAAKNSLFPEPFPPHHQGAYKLAKIEASLAAFRSQIEDHVNPRENHGEIAANPPPLKLALYSDPNRG